MNLSNLRFPASPNLPLAPRDWVADYQEQYSNVLRLYFNQLSSGLQQLTSTGGGYKLSFPYGAFYDTTVQSAASTTTAYVVQLNSTSLNNGISVTNGSRMKVNQEGIYNLQFSIQFNNSANAPFDVDVWVRQNGVDIPNSNSRFGLSARKNPGDPFHIIGALNFMAEMKVDDYLELAWMAGSTSVSITGYAAGTSPTRPVIPSVIATLSFVSAPVR